VYDTAGGNDVVVCLGPGTHLLHEKPLTLTEAHSPDGIKVQWRSEDFENPAVISGGVALTKWVRCNDGVHCPWESWNDVWVSFVSDAKAGVALPKQALPVRQLWVNGDRATRIYTDTSMMGLKATPTGFTAASTDHWSVENLLEMRWPTSIKNWIEPRCVITGISGTNITVEPICWKSLIARNGGKLPPAPTFIDNFMGPSNVPGPGEFSATPDYVFYRPPASDPYAAPQDAWVPSLDSLIVADNVSNHEWSGVTFSHGTWRQPTLPGGYVPSQSAVNAATGEPIGAVNVTRARNISFDKCSFTNIGAAYALSIGHASQGVRVTGNKFYDLSGGAVKLGNVNDTRATTTDPTQWDMDMVLEQNTMEDMAIEFSGAAAVFAGYVAETTIAHNTIKNTGYTGISLGWGWGSHVKGPQTFARNNHITGNSLIGVMSALNDGGCTYTLGPQPNSTVSGNYCQQDRAPVVGCFYHDNGSRYFKTFDNVAESSPAPCVYLQGCCNSPAYDIAVSNLWCRSTAPVRNGCAAENCVIDAKTLYVISPTTQWPAAAQAIIDAAGASSSAYIM
jgi:hypothetical protein